MAAKKNDTQENTTEEKAPETVTLPYAKFSALMEKVGELEKKVLSGGATVLNPEKPNMTEIQNHLNEEVPFYAFKDEDKYKDDILVGINGKNWQIKRGVHVMIPRFVYEAIIDSERQKMSAVEIATRYADKFEAKARELKI